MPDGIYPFKRALGLSYNAGPLRFPKAPSRERSTPMITSAQNPRIKRALRLRSSRGRRQQQRMILDGVREIRRAFRSGVAFVELFVCDELCHADARALVGELSSAGFQGTPVTESVFRKLAYGERGEGLVAVAPMPPVDLGRLRMPPNALVAVLERIEKPGNVGAVLRSADAAGVQALLLADGGTDLYHPNTIRASLGAVFSVPVASAPNAQVRAWLDEQGFTLLAARVEAAHCYTDVVYRGRVAVVLGSEAHGLSDFWKGPEITPIRLPMRGVVDSLNVSVAASVIFFEACRQRTAVSGRVPPDAIDRSPPLR